MGSLEDYEIAAGMADTHVGEAHSSTEKANKAYNKGYGHVGAALGMLLEVIDEFGFAEQAFNASRDHMKAADSAIEKARKIVEDIGLSDSSNPLAKGQAEKIQQIAESTEGSLALTIALGAMMARLEGLTTDFGTEELASVYTTIEEGMVLPVVLEQMVDYRRLAEAYFGR